MGLEVLEGCNKVKISTWAGLLELLMSENSCQPAARGFYCNNKTSSSCSEAMTIKKKQNFKIDE